MNWVRVSDVFLSWISVKLTFVNLRIDAIDALTNRKEKIG